METDRKEEAHTFLFLSDLLHQTSDLDIFFPLFTRGGRWTAAFWEEVRLINGFILKLSYRIK